MKLAKASSVEELQVISRFESLRKILLTDHYADHLEKPLAYWALPTDRRLPLAFLSRTLGVLLATPYADLSETPGIGQKKMSAFVNLLARAANTDPSELPAGLGATLEDGYPAGGQSAVATNGFDPAGVSEVVWEQWRASVVKHGLENETLGRFAPSLRDMTRVIWNATLGEYTERTLSEIRVMKTHGEKRVRAILEVFHGLHVLLAEMGTQDHLVVRVVPQRIDAVERWIDRTLQAPGCPSQQEIDEQFVMPLRDQIRTDASGQIAALAENRLGFEGPVTSVRNAARAMGLTRARVYQLLNEINDIMMVRWPNGRHQVYELEDKLHREAAEAPDPPDLARFDAAVELLYPGSRRGADGPLEHPTAAARTADEQEAAGELLAAQLG